MLKRTKQSSSNHTISTTITCINPFIEFNISKTTIMKNPVIVFIFAAVLLAFNVQAQDKLSWKKHIKLADELYAKAQYADAGEHYRAAYKQKTKKKEFAYKAGECFFTMRDYRNAADVWKNIKDDNATYPLIGLRYARCLKQNGEHEAASNELVKFLGNYNGTDKATVTQIVQNEIKGCELAAQYNMKGDGQSYPNKGGFKEMVQFKGSNSDGEEFQAYAFYNEKTGTSHMLLLKERGLSRQPAKVRQIVDSVRRGISN